MKTGKILKTLTLVAGLAAGASAYAGDIYDIVPWSSQNAKSGEIREQPWATISNPLRSGETVYFNVRLFNNVSKATATPEEFANSIWYPDLADDYIGSEYVAQYTFPLQVGLYASGKLTYASLVDYYANPDNGVTHLVFAYETKAGDFALPVVLATGASEASAEPAREDGTSPVYLLNNYATNSSGYWRIRNRNNQDAVFSYGAPEWPISGIDTSSSDYTLAKAGIYVQTVEFDSRSASDDLWRTVYMNSATIKDGGSTLTLATTAPADALGTYYVWSDDESAVRIYNGVTTTLGNDENGDPIVREVAAVKIDGNSSVSQEFKIWGVTSNKTCNLVLSPFPYYTYWPSQDPLHYVTNFVTVAVSCAEPLPPTLLPKVDIIDGVNSTIYASGDYLKPAATITFSVSEPPTAEFEARLVPSFSGDAGATNWWDYVYFATVDQLNDAGELSEFSESSKTQTPPTVTFSPTATSHTFYLFALRADGRTNRPGHQMKFTPEFDASPYANLSVRSVSYYIEARKPVITTPEEGGTISATSGEETPIRVAVDDTFADITSTNGYTIVFTYDSHNPSVTTKITGLVPGAKNILYVANEDGTPSAKLPTVSYSSEAGTLTSTIVVTSPVSELESDPRTISAVVSDPKSITLTVLDESEAERTAFVEGEEATFNIKLSQKNQHGFPLYAYLVPSEELAPGMFDGDTPFIVGMADTLEGIEIPKSSDEGMGSIKFLDDAHKATGAQTTSSRITLSVVLTTEKNWDGTNTEKVVTGYSPASARLKVTNVAPTVGKIKIGTQSLDPEAIYATKLPIDAERRFSVDINKDEVLADLAATNATEKFQTAWSTWCYQVGDGESVDDYADDAIPGLQFEQMDPNGEATILYGNPKELSFTNTFAMAGIWRITCQVKDKDSDEFSEEYNIYLKVTDAGVSVTQLENFEEARDASQQLTVSINYFDSQFAGTVYVGLKVKSNAASATNPGRLKFNESFLWSNVWPGVEPYEIADNGATTNAYDAASDYYLLKFTKNHLSEKLTLRDVDGVNNSFTYSAYVVSAQRNGVETVLPASGKLAADYYAASEQCQVTVMNADPIRSYIRVSPNPDVNTNVWTSAKTINWTIPYNSDVQGDFDKGIKVEITGDGLVESYSTNIFETASGSFTPNFGGASGRGEIVMTVTDLDGGIQEWVWYYDLPAVKTLITIPNGPTGTGNHDRSARHYATAAGRGQGHIFPRGATFNSAAGWYLTWFCPGMTDVTVYGYGYKVGAFDNGWLDGGNDQAINGSGNTAARANTAAQTAGYYGYAGNLDSYLYAWMITAPATEAGAAEWHLTLAPEQPSSAAIPATAYLPTSETEDGSYIATRVEAVFSKEFLESDNLGDINQDGVPDVFAVRDWAGGSLLELVGGTAANDENVNDLVGLAGSNPDEDMMPAIFTQDANYVNVENGQRASYAPIGQALTTITEIRGFHEGLNETVVTTSGIYMSDEELAARQNWYDRVADGTIALDGMDADAFVAAYPTADALPLAVWSPEVRGQVARMDPTLADTDGDGFPDGWEYFFWYQAQVWKPAADAGFEDADVKGSPRHGQTYVFERFDEADPLNGTEITTEEVKERFNPCTQLPPNVLALNPDFDNDGLSDLEELVVGSNPCHWDTDGDHMSDGWELMMCLDPLSTTASTNPDGDWMAEYTTSTAALYLDPASTDWTTADARIYILPAGSYGALEYTTENGNMVASTTAEATVKAIAFSPKMDGDEVLRYGRTDGLPPGPVGSHHWGFMMVDDVERDVEITIPAGSEIRMGMNFIFIHDQVRDAFGFDPRTAWNVTNRGYVDNRWDPGLNSDLNRSDTTGLAMNTREYATYDEYLVMMYRRKYGIIYSPLTETPEPNDLFARIRMKTTNPSVAYPAVENDGDEAAEGEEGENAQATAAAAIAEAVQQAGGVHTPVTTHGADTDLDGVPDGWELYTFRCPNTACDTREETNPGAIPNDFDGDGLNYVAEFAGVDSCNAYRDCESIYANHTGEAGGWWNKFFPTDPGTMTPQTIGLGNADGADTDMDGILDGAEGGGRTGYFYNGGNVYQNVRFTFCYGTQADDGSCCIRGGGMNPCTIDTDQDGLPDSWEFMNAGVRASAVSRTCLADNAELDDATFVADGLLGGAAAAEGAADVVYIAGGMDATWAADFCSPVPEDPFLAPYSATGGSRDVDFDHDGLQNYQEYLVQTVRHFRYDDTTTPLMGRVLTEGEYDPATGALVSNHSQRFMGYVPFDASAPETFAGACALAWAGKEGAAELLETLTATNGTYRQRWDDDGWRALGYFAPPVKAFDRSFTAGNFGLPLYISMPAGATDFVSTDPRMADTDADGMDDYYEMFHGLNPILGSEWTDPYDGSVSPKRGDIIAGALGTILTRNAFCNEWIYPNFDRNGLSATIGAPECFDPILYPWIMGTALADADGDGLRNDEERILANATDPMPRHTDPTPLWMTDSSTPASYTAQYYVTPSLYPGMISRQPAPADDFQDAAMQGSAGPGFAFGFEENEGYDTDNDWTPDSREVVTTATTSTDPLVYDDPKRRQAIWFNGKDAFAMSVQRTYRPFDASDFLTQFTVECWVRPEKAGAEQTIVDRSVYYPGSNIGNDSGAIRANFRIGVDADGRVYGMFDNNDAVESGLNRPVSCQYVSGRELPLNDWTHVAVTFDGSVLTLYVNGSLESSATTALRPANGVTQERQAMGSTNLFAGAYTAMPAALFVGARPVKATKETGSLALEPVTAGDVASTAAAYALYRDFFKGYVDEVRIWDGARTADDIASAYQTRIGYDEAVANREKVFQAWWLDEASRNNNDANETLPAELVMHYNFQTLPGAVYGSDVALTPSGFAKNVLAAAQSDYTTNPDIDPTGLYATDMTLKGGVAGAAEGGLLVGWWNDCLTHSKVYKDYHVVPWIENMIPHLPQIDGGTVDSFIYHEHFGAGYTLAEMLGLERYIFPNSGVPDGSMVYRNDRYYRLRQLERLNALYGGAIEETYERYCFYLRGRLLGSSDLVPMGGAYAKTCPKMWDGHVADAWEYTGSDENSDGLPDWWVEYAKNNLSPELEPSASIGWDTIVTYRGLRMTAGQAYLVQLALGLQPDGEVDSAYRATVDADGNGVPDWWEKIFGLEGAEAGADADGDGLSNAAEYLLSFVFDTGTIFDPLDPTSQSEYELDYFFPVGSLYAGEIFSDHDMMEDSWERKHGAGYVSPYAWDALGDKDEDGWSAFAECRYNTFSAQIAANGISHMLGDQEVRDFPTPTLKLTLRYNEMQSLAAQTKNENGGNGDDQMVKSEDTLAPIVVKTYTDKPLQTDNVVPDATFKIRSGEATELYRYLGAYTENTIRGSLTPGHIQVATLDIEFAYLPSDDMIKWSFTNPLTGERNYYRSEYDAYLSYRSYYGAAYVQMLAADYEWSSLSDTAGITVTQDKETGEGKIRLEGEPVGFLNAETGEFAVSLEPFSHWISTSTNGAGSVAMEDCIFRIKYTANLPVLGANKLDVYLGSPNMGYVKEGLNHIVAFYDLNDDGEYTPGEPLGYKGEVDVGWYQAAADIELTDVSPVITRALITSMGSSESGSGSGEAEGGVVTDRNVLYGDEDGDYKDLIQGYLAGGKNQRFRIVRTLVNGYSISTLGIPNAVVVDKWLDLGQRPFFFEGDVLDDGEFDLDWSTYQAQVAAAVPGLDVTSVVYRVVLGNGTIEPNATNNLFSIATVRHFDANNLRTTPVAVSPGSSDSVVYGSRPTFKWSMGVANSYTAFRLEILDGSSVVWNSGIRRAPSRDSNGNYTFVPDVYAGDLLQVGKSYRWRVSMYNAKFRTDAWSNTPTFYVDTQTTSADYGTINACVKYFGPSLSSGTVRVEAFETPDFTGDPVARTYLRSTALVNKFGTNHVANATLIGLEPGTYYLRAYIDASNRGTVRRRDEFEPWGYACPRSRDRKTPYTPSAVAVAAGVAVPQTFDIYIEDVDTNANNVPDLYELSNGGSLSAGATQTDTTLAGGIAVSSAVVDLTQRSDATSETTGLGARLASSLKSASVASMVLGVEGGENALADAVNNATKVVEGTLAVTGLTLDPDTRSVKLTVDADVENAYANTIASVIYTFPSETEVTVQVWRKTSLSDGWGAEPYATKKVTLGGKDAEIVIDLGDDIDLASGFFKVTLAE